MASSHNDLNVLQRSPVFQRLCEGHAPGCNYSINGREYDRGYYLGDGIYPDWSTFVKTIRDPVGEASNSFAKKQEVVRKDVEKAFSVLQARFVVVRYLCLSWSIDQICDVMNACIIMHNMIIESERDITMVFDEPFDFQGPLADPQPGVSAEFDDFLGVYQEIRDEGVHHQIQVDLVAHLWAMRANE